MEASKDLTLKAVYSRSLKSAKTLSSDTSNVDLYSDDSGSGKGYKDLLQRSDIHAVIIASVPQLYMTKGTIELTSSKTRLPILNQPEYIRAALSAGKHVLSEKPIAENVKDAADLIQWYHSNIDTKRVTWAVAENFRYLNSFDHAQQEVQKLGRVLGFRVRLYGNVEAGSKYYGMVISRISRGGLWLNSDRNRMAEDTNTSRWIPAGWRCPFHRRYSTATWL